MRVRTAARRRRLDARDDAVRRRSPPGRPPARAVGRSARRRPAARAAAPPAAMGRWLEPEPCSGGKSAFISMSSATKNRSSNVWPTKSSPSRPRVEPMSQATSQSAASRSVLQASRSRHERQRRPPRCPDELAANLMSILSPTACVPIDQVFLVNVLLQVDEGGMLVAGLRQQVERVDLVVAMEEPPTFQVTPLSTTLGDTEPIGKFRASASTSRSPASHSETLSPSS